MCHSSVKCVLGNGQEASSSSNGFYIDDTPAKLDVLFYVDINRNAYEPTEFQSSNSTIKVLWSFIDMQSQVKVLNLSFSVLIILLIFHFYSRVGISAGFRTRCG